MVLGVVGKPPGIICSNVTIVVELQEQWACYFYTKELPRCLLLHCVTFCYGVLKSRALQQIAKHRAPESHLLKVGEGLGIWHNTKCLTVQI